MKHQALLRLAAFLVVFVLLIALANTFFIRADTYASLTMSEIKARDDIELAIVGSSAVQLHFNADLISEQTGLKAFNAGFASSGLQASLAVTEELFRTNSPEWVVLVVEPFTFYTARELPQAQYELMPLLSSPMTRLRYYLRAAREDGAYLDRLFMFREFGVTSFRDALKTIGLRLSPQKTYEKILPTLDPTMHYRGNGFIYATTETSPEADIRKELIREVTGYEYPLLEPSKKMLLEYRDLCREHGARLLVMVYPELTAFHLARPDFLPYLDSLRRFCAENDLECVDFTFARPELYPNMDDYYFDTYHMIGEGADVLSASFSRFFNLYAAGEDTSSLFYQNTDEYLASIDFITNTWIQTYTPDSWNPAWEQNPQSVAEAAIGKDVYLANCNHGSLVTPEYRFFLIEEDGTETPLTDWQTDGILTCSPGALTGRTLKLYARPQGQTETVWFTWRPGLDPEPVLL